MIIAGIFIIVINEHFHFSFAPPAVIVLLPCHIAAGEMSFALDIIGNNEILPYRRVQKFLFFSKAVLDCTFLIYHAKPEKQSKINKFGNSIPKVSNWHFEMAL
jgi:hypothetical protein